MTNEALAHELREIHTKLDWISDEMTARKRQSQEFDELKGDLSLIAKDVFNTAVVELEDVAPFVSTGDFLHLIKRVIRNTNAISDSISRLESFLDFIQDARPLGNDIFAALLTKLDELEKRGYFRFACELAKATDRSMGSMKPDDARKVAESLVMVVKLVTAIANSNILPALVKAAQTIQDKDASDFDHFNPWTAHRIMSQKEMRRAVGMSMEFLKIFANETNNSNVSKGVS